MFNLFVYGTLKRNEGANHFLKDCTFVGNAVTKDAKFNMKSNNGYFPFVFNNGDKKIAGEIYECPDQVLPYLDMYEGYRPDGSGLYLRNEFDYVLDNGKDIKAIMYYQNDTSVVKNVNILTKDVKLNENIFTWSSKNA